MAIAFNLPSEREATEENFSRLNRLLAELYEVLCHILVSRQPGQEVQDTRRGECPPDPIAPPYNLRCNSTYIVNLVMVVAIIKVSLSSSLFNTIR
ncbi:IAP-binding motif 1 [Operophtera brumata]|uniref:IAP-binding motif 1 n=1 Tax=Operophtera brumata TaxID=104452 RepID=A0A0L7L9W4_OPEBR|nr:IAP-binding motif 1 [Operophtera brumata]